MLNELFALQRGLAAHGVSAGARHPDVKELGKGDVIRVRLTDAGGIAQVELVPPGDRSVLWTLRDGQQNGFPGLKTLAGLLDIPPAVLLRYEESWRTARQPAGKRRALLALINECPPRPMENWPKPGHRQRIAERAEQLRALGDDPHTAAVPAAFTFFRRALEGKPSFLVALADAVVDEVQNGDEAWLTPAWTAFTGPAVLLIDVAHGQMFSRRVGDSRQIAAVSAALALHDGSGKDARRSTGDCALSGSSSRLLDGNFPQPNLPGLGQTYLFARNRDIPAMARYGRSGAASMPIDAELAGRLNSAVSELTDRSRQGKTWRLITAEAGGKPDLFLASLPTHLDLPVADAIAGIEDDEDGWPVVEMAAQGVVSLWEGRADSASPQDEVLVLVLRTVDPANRKAIFARRVTAGTLHKAAVEWSAAMHNAPTEITFLVLSKHGGKQRCPPALAPLSLVRLSRHLFVNGGRRVNELTGEPASEALALFLKDGGLQGRATRLLRLLLQRQQGLSVNLARLKAMGGDYLRSFDSKSELRRQALYSLSWLGALLFMLGRPKEVYMEDFGFKLGQLLAAMDAVHIGYCADVRGGDIPSTLLGNAVFSTAGRDPERALDVLQGRWKPYAAWAQRDTAVRAKASRLILGKDEQRGWQMRRGLSQARLAGELSEQLRVGLTDTVIDERFRAELLLGYLAGIRTEKKTEITEVSKTNKKEPST